MGCVSVGFLPFCTHLVNLVEEKFCTKREFAQVGWHTTIALCPNGRSELPMGALHLLTVGPRSRNEKKNPACRLAQPTPALSQSRVATLGSPPIS